MKEICLNDLGYPLSYIKMFSKSIQIYRGSFFNYFILSLLIYLPFLLIEQLGKIEFVFLIEIFHGNFLDILVFLTLPTLIIHKKVFPLGTIQIFLQRFLASAVTITFIQLAFNFLGIIGFIPYLFILFAGFFLVIENSSKIINVKSCMIQSVQLMRNFFFAVTWNFILITILVNLPVSLFAIWYFSDHQGLWEVLSSLESVQKDNTVSFQQLFEASVRLTREPGFMFGRILLHIVFRPIKSIFMASVFISLMHHLYPERINNEL